jgi:DNA-binding GntR family transcriptional regulator
VVKSKLVIEATPTIRRKVHHHLREQILSGKIGPNERLIETRIAQDIGTSRTPVREALHNLEMEGLIESIPRVGYKVKPISGEEAAEIYEIRCLIEVLAIRWAMGRGKDRLLKALRANVDLAEERLAGGDVGAMVDLDAQFHESIARLSGGKRLLELAQTLSRHALRYRLQGLYGPGSAERALRGHKGILTAIEGGDEAEINAAVVGHLAQFKEDAYRDIAVKRKEKKR